jgi:hypothetical protein
VDCVLARGTNNKHTACSRVSSSLRPLDAANRMIPPWAAVQTDITVKVGGLLSFFAVLRSLPYVIELALGVHTPTAVEAGFVKY